MNSSELLQFLDQNAIPYQRFDHRAVYTVEEAEDVLPGIPGAGTKNLFLIDDSGERHLLLMTLGEKRVQLKQLAAQVDTKKLHFAPFEDLEPFLGVGRGAVTALGVINDSANRVELWIDRELWQHPAVHCHPLVNTCTLVIAPADLERFFELTNHPPRFVEGI